MKCIAGRGAKVLFGYEAAYHWMGSIIDLRIKDCKLIFHTVDHRLERAEGWFYMCKQLSPFCTKSRRMRFDVLATQKCSME